MKRVFLIIIGLAGIGGLIALLVYHPKSPAVASTSGTSQQQSPSVSPDPSSSASATNASPSPSSTASAGKYKDGTYTGTTAQITYGPVQVQAVIQNGKLTSVNVLQMPSDSNHAIALTAESKPILIQEAISAQDANVDSVSGATMDSQGFTQSLQSALSQAANS